MLVLVLTYHRQTAGSWLLHHDHPSWQELTVCDYLCLFVQCILYQSCQQPPSQLAVTLTYHNTQQSVWLTSSRRSCHQIHHTLHRFPRGQWDNDAKSGFRKSKMMDGRHLGFRFLAIISESINIFAPNLVTRRKIGSPGGPSAQKSGFRKSKMADERHLRFKFWAKTSSYSHTSLKQQILYRKNCIQCI